MIAIYKDKKSLCLVDTSSKTMSTICGYGFDKLVKGLETNEYGWFNFDEHFEEHVLDWQLISSYKTFNGCKNTEVLDTQNLAPLHLLTNKNMSLGNVVRETLDEEPEFLHNGGNDAFYTLKSLLKMAEVL